MLGVYRPLAPERRRSAAGRIEPTDRSARAEWMVPPGHEGGAEAGDIVLAAPMPGGRYGLQPARIVERLGRIDDARAISLISIHTHDIPHQFPASVVAEAERARAVPLGRREDLRALPLITIDGEDARDFDDAAYAEPSGDGFRLVVAIADVAHYVRPGSALDREAEKRGNSVYFPDRVVPMLPEALSNGWCSLRPGEDRATLFVDMRIDRNGRRLEHRFGRGLMRSAARLTYEQVQRAADRGSSAGLPPGLIRHLYGALEALLSARQARGTLDLDLPERVVRLNSNGAVAEVAPRARLDSHRLVEEFMVLANVAAAEELERLQAPCMYRIHPPPSDEKLANLRSLLKTFGLRLPAGARVHPRDLDRVLRQVSGEPQAPLVHEAVLRSQAQAQYGAENIGHFGLALPRYAHFTSPIRRYADLLVHRALIGGLALGDGALGSETASGYSEIGTHLTLTERRAAMAERDATDRYLAAYLAERVGDTFAGRISGVTRFGLFVTLEGNGASGIVPLSTLPDDVWTYDEGNRTLAGRRTRATFRLGQDVAVRLVEASPVTGGLVLHLVASAAATLRSGPRPRRAAERAARSA